MENMNKMAQNRIRLSREYELLRNCAKNSISVDSKHPLKDILNKDLNWAYILEEARKQGILSLLYKNLWEFKHKIPRDIWNKIENAYYLVASRNTKIYKEIEKIFAAFRNKNLEIMPLKGIFLAENVYDNIALRNMADIDILVKKGDLPKTDEILHSLGYNSKIHKDLLSIAIEKSYLNSLDYYKIKSGPNAPETLTLHIHWHIVNVSLPTYLYSKGIKMDRFWEHSSLTKIGDTDTLQMAPHHLILYLCEHVLKHSFDKLILLSDIDAAIEKYKEYIDWQKLIYDAKDFGMERAVFYALYFVNYFLDTSVPDIIFTQLRPEKTGILERWFFNSVLNNRRNLKLCYFVYLGMIKGARNKFRFIFRTVFPPPCALALFFNLGRPKIILSDYFSFLAKRFSRLKRT